ncbi:hypothetical protein [Halopiger djelfimassiliensis]|uniref:hypothetical protein n=1 Tax=Halopiger djelfimassiliensis TaxID=1293047 RepID=UPI0006776512|nr:hypothetical protein [Halopiger djelfimassiliensis]
MVSLQGLAVALLGFAIVVGCAGAVYRDATRVGVSRAGPWAGFVALTVGSGFAGYLFPFPVPVPGLLVIVLAGPALYLFERDDAKHGGGSADPRSLPGDSGDDSGADRGREE